MDISNIKKNALFLIDGSYLLYRSYFALPPLHTPEGKPINALFGFCRTLNAMLNHLTPEHIAVVWDSKGGSTERKEIFAEYKATRQAPPSDLHVQKEDIIKFIETIGMANISTVGYEADDLIASIAFNNKDSQTVIVCADKDMYQLLSDNVLIIDPFKDRVINEHIFEQENGFPPSKIPFYYALLGDTSDNIPGVKGIGKKTAQDLIQQFESLEQMYQNLDTIEKARTKKLLEEQKENAFLSYKLFLLTYTGYKISPEESAYNSHNWAHAAEFFKEFNFKGLLKDLEKRFKKEIQTSIGGQEPQEQEVEKEEPRNWNLKLITTVQELETLITQLNKHTFFGFDTETSGTQPLNDKLVGMSFAYDTQDAYYLPLQHPIDEKTPQIELTRALALLKPVLESQDIKKTLHNTKFDELVLINNGINFKGCSFDTLIAANVLRKEWQRINLKDLSMSYLGEKMIKFKDVMGKTYKSFDQVPIDHGAAYGAHDALQTYKLALGFEKDLEHEPTLKKLFEEIEMPLYHVLTAMELRGVLLDPNRLKEIELLVDHDLATIEGKIYAALGEEDGPLNLNSPRQIETLLFERLKLPSGKRSKKGARSTDQEVLEELSKIHPIPSLILKHRELSKLKNTYLEPLPTFINPHTKRIHTQYSQTNTATGRLSSNDPNLQNIPVAGTYGIKVRSAFVAPQDHLFLSADYSQIELRVLAHLSGDKNLTQVFLDNKDIHIQTASQLFKVELNDVTHEQRQFGKLINFSVIYGKTAYGLSRELNITPAQAKEYIETYFQQYPQVSTWMDHIVETTIEKGYVETAWGKRRYVPELRERNRTRFELGKRIAVNTAVQGTQADIIKIAMRNIHKALQEENFSAGIILQIHDELIIEVPSSELKSVEYLVKTKMETVTNWKVPIVVSMRTGANWEESTK